jgi:hypothetical protein
MFKNINYFSKENIISKDISIDTKEALTLLICDNPFDENNIIFLNMMEGIIGSLLFKTKSQNYIINYLSPKYNIRIHSGYELSSSNIGYDLINYLNIENDIYVWVTNNLC